MKLMTKELEEKFKKYPLGSQENLGGNAKVQVEYFNPVGAGTWLITEADRLDNGDYEMFGYVHLGDDENAEFGYVMLSELSNLRLPFGMSIERELYLQEDKTILEAMKSCGITPPSYLMNKDDEVLEMEEL